MKTLSSTSQAQQALQQGEWPLAPPPGFLQGPIHSPAIGLLELSVEVVMAKELLAFCPAEASLYTGRMAFSGETTIEGLSAVACNITSAAALLPDAQWLHAIVYGCTSGTIVLGQERVAELIHRVRPGVPVVTPIGAVLKALRSLDLGRLAVVTPYVPSINQLVARTLDSAGLEIVSARTFGQRDADDMFRTPAQAFLDAALEADSPDADGIFISCTGICVSPVIEELERRTGKPVVTSNQAIAWQCREIAGAAPTANDLGLLFQQRLID
ncbi:aspartate/glutamate racemase family protein [Pseudomonas sp. S 311-6]|uniref:maleate cis-trans isomerase family protein n=1 Tax=Pseudomonas TaxID=286 RepID=UPI002097792C|nr:MULTISPECIES: aspartate/glutamate racemase family protein [Pseudomonas]MCO7568205.1 aspartate/glutamate racemase family protein [Pseudomonas mosselii]MCO7619882.1 aspartate/glutamate racemase family protein [Pseudomonas guariconensis]MCO7643613.1 aspartate/glutamate racemase family protein [Pseudomonas sp. S 311-6]